MQNVISASWGTGPHNWIWNWLLAPLDQSYLQEPFFSKCLWFRFYFYIFPSPDQNCPTHLKNFYETLILLCCVKNFSERCKSINVSMLQNFFRVSKTSFLAIKFFLITDFNVVQTLIFSQDSQALILRSMLQFFKTFFKTLELCNFQLLFRQVLEKYLSEIGSKWEGI